MPLPSPPLPTDGVQGACATKAARTKLVVLRVPLRHSSTSLWFIARKDGERTLTGRKGGEKKIIAPDV